MRRCATVIIGTFIASRVLRRTLRWCVTSTRLCLKSALRSSPELITQDPDYIVAAVGGGGSNAIGAFYYYIDPSKRGS